MSTRSQAGTHSTRAHERSHTTRWSSLTSPLTVRKTDGTDDEPEDLDSSDKQCDDVDDRDGERGGGEEERARDGDAAARAATLDRVRRRAGH